MNKNGNVKLYLALLIISALCIFQLFLIINDSHEDNRKLRIEDMNLKDEHYISLLLMKRLIFCLIRLK